VVGEGRRGRAIAWPDGVAGRPSRLREWPYAARLPRWALRVGEWAEAETGPGRAILWTPIAFGLGIAIYFTASHEPLVWAPVGAFALAAIVVWLLRARPVGFTLAILSAALVAGFLTATLRTWRAEHTVLTRPLFGASLSGWIETREERERTDRIVIALASFEPGRGSDAKLERVRISVRKGTAPPPGSFVSLKARLSPPLAPLRPGGYAFRKSARPALRSARSSAWKQKTLRRSASDFSAVSPDCATSSTHAFAPRCQATRARLLRH
jgi:competence protein ComEC